MRLIDADAFKEYITSACEDMKHLFNDGGAVAKLITESFCKDIDEQPTIQPEITHEQAVAYLQSTGWMQEHDRQMMLDGVHRLTAQPEPHWIPVTERLPETSDAVLTTYIVNGDRSRRYVEESSYYGNDDSWSSPWDEYRIAGTRIEVIAWMPMPVPWKGE